MTGSRRARLAGAIIFILSAGLPFVLLALIIFGPASRQKTEPGMHRLYLPSGIDVMKDSLAGWKNLCVVPPEESHLPLDDDTGPVAAPVLDDNSFRVEVYGFINEGSHRLYCFLDTEAKRWFSLPEGEVDKKAQVALLQGADDRQPELVDLLTGNCYRIEPGFRRLTAVFHNIEEAAK
jgi:hypothetical protein